MRRQRNTEQMKEQGKNSPDQTNEEEMGSLPEKEFRVLIVKMIQNLEWRKYRKRSTGQQGTRSKEQTNSDEQHNK